MKSASKNHTILSKEHAEIDIWLLRDNLKLSYEARVIQHQKTLNCINLIKGKGRQKNARSSRPS